MNALDLINSPPVSGDEIMRATIRIEQNAGVKFPREKWLLLAEQIVADGWSIERFKRTAEWMIRSHSWQNWTVADWFRYSVEMHPESWYQDQVHEHGASVNAQIEIYNLGDGLYGYRYADGQRLPFPVRGIRETEWR